LKKLKVPKVVAPPGNKLRLDNGASDTQYWLQTTTEANLVRWEWVQSEYDISRKLPAIFIGIGQTGKARGTRQL